MTDELTVLMVWPNIDYPGNDGGAVHLTEVSHALADHVDLHVACNCGEDFTENGVHYHHVDGGRFSIGAFPKILELSKDADIIHSRADPFEIAGPLAAKFRNIPVIGEVNVNFLAYEKKHTKRDLLYPVFHSIKYLWLKLFVQRLSHVVCVSNVIKQELQDIGFAEDKLSVVHNGGNPENTTGLEKEDMRDELRLPQDDYVVLLMGELGPRHGLERLIDTDLENVTFLVVGGKERYQDYIGSLKEEASDNFIFHDPVPYEEIKKFIVASDVAVAPYEESDNDHQFGFCPIKILDAMAAGRPVVASDREWIREILSEKEGEVTDDIADGILALQDDERHERKGQNAQTCVEDGLSWRHTAERLYDIYQRLTGGAE